MLSVFLLCILSLLLRADSLSTSDLVKIEGALHDRFMEDFDAVASPHFPTAHQCIRLSFHDCVGGCDGCLDISRPDNANLDNTISALEGVWFKENVMADGISIANVTGFSRADFWAFAGAYALKFLSQCPKRGPGDRCSDTEINVDFRYGRTDCATAPFATTTIEFPSSHGNLTAVNSFFQTNFDFHDKEVVAIMGAHTVGKAHRFASGHRGRWTDQWDKPNSKFYDDIRDQATHNWTQVNVAGNKGNKPPKWQWNEQANSSLNMMLNVDMCLYKNIQTDAAGQSSCDYASCGPSASAGHVDLYADDNDVWLTDFQAVFKKMIERGPSGDIGSTLLTPTGSKKKREADPLAQLFDI